VTILRRAYVKVEPDTSTFDRDLKDRLRRINAKAEGEKVGQSFGEAFTKQLSGHLKDLDLPQIDLKANPRDALQAIDKTERELKALSRAADSVELRMKSESALDELGRLRKRIGDVGDDGATGFFAKFSQRLGPLVASLPLSPPMLVAVGGAAAAAAPVLASALAGGVLIGVGGGVIAAGLKIAAKDPAVQEAGIIAGKEFSQGLSEAAAPFKDEIISALGVARAEFRQLRPEIDGLFADAAPHVRTLVQSLASMGRTLLPGIRDAVREMGPLIDVLAVHGPRAAALFSDALSAFAEDSENAAESVDALLKSIEFLVASTIASLALLNKIMPFVSGNFLILADILPGVGDKSKDAAAGSAELAEQLRQGSADALANTAAMERTKAGTEALRLAQKALSDSQGGLNSLLESFSPAGGRAARTVDAMRQATDNLYGATIAASEANEGFQASWDSLSDAVSANGRTLNIHTVAGRSNRDALQDVIGRTNDLYFAELATGQSIAGATKKHNDRIAAIKEEAKRLGLNREETQKLISTYGQIPPKKATQLILEGLNAIADALTNVYLAQRALAEGKTVDQVRGGYQGRARLFKASGGYIDGPGTKTSDSIDVRASRGEFMQRAAAVDYYGVGAMHALNQQRIPREALQGYAGGGLIAPVDTSRRWPFRVDISDSFVMSKADALKRVTPPFPAQGSPTLDFMVKAIRQAFPGLALISGYRPGARTLSGNASYHAFKRAVDYPPSWDLANWVNQNYKARTKEFISPYQDMNILNGQRHTYTGAVWNQHNFSGGNAHDHWAMDRGGWLMPGWNGPIFNGTGQPEPVIPADKLGGNTYHLTVNVPATAHPAETGRAIVEAIKAFEAGSGTRWRKP
jgi:hypothetical protein